MSKRSYTKRTVSDGAAVATIVDYGASYKDDIAMCLYITMTVLLRSLGEVVDPMQLKQLANTDPQYGICAERPQIQTIADIYDLKINVYRARDNRLDHVEIVKGSGKNLRPVPVFWYEGIHFANVFYFEDPEHERRILDEYASILDSPSIQVLEDHLMALSLQKEF